MSQIKLLFNRKEETCMDRLLIYYNKNSTFQPLKGINKQVSSFIWLNIKRTCIAEGAIKSISCMPPKGK